MTSSNGRHRVLALGVWCAALLVFVEDDNRPMAGYTFARPTTGRSVICLGMLGSQRPLPVSLASSRPGQTNRRALSKNGHMEEVFEEFNNACGQNPFYPTWDFCFPDTEAVVAALSSSKNEDFTSDEFLHDVNMVFHQFHTWPPAWPGMAQLLDPSKPWTQAYCEKVISSESWSPFYYFSPNMNAFSPLMQLTLTEAQASPPGALLTRYFSTLRDSEDPETVRLWTAFAASDQDSWRKRTVRSAPLEALLQYEMSKLAEHILKLCGTAATQSIFERRDSMGQTLLHQTASDGNTALAKVLINSVPEGSRTDFIDTLDMDGYSALDAAHSGGYSATKLVISQLRGQSHQVRNLHPLSLFPAPAKIRSRSVDSGGWSCSDAGAVPADWLPAADAETTVDSIDVSQFDWRTFERHYVRHRRPLLVRGGAEMDASVAQLYSRRGLLDAAGSRQVKIFDVPYADAVGLEEPVFKSIRDYVKFLDDRLTRDPEKELGYVFVGVPDDDMLGFATSLPRLLEGKVQQLRAQFCLGGVLMGSAMHYHTHAANSLVHGRKLWLLLPPAQKEFRKTRVFDDLNHRDEPQGVQRLVQEAGDLFYVPAGWNHAAMCMGHCIGVAHEFDLLPTSSERLH